LSAAANDSENKPREAEKSNGTSEDNGRPQVKKVPAQERSQERSNTVNGADETGDGHYAPHPVMFWLVHWLVSYRKCQAEMKGTLFVRQLLLCVFWFRFIHTDDKKYTTDNKNNRASNAE
jgi:hypothetical protein